MRKAIADLALSLVGLNEKDGSFKPIIDIYNKATSGYNVKYTDAWCATFVSALAIMQGIQDIFPIECSCARMVKKAQAMGIWVENDAFVPHIGDIIMYDWQDNGKGDNKGNPDHVGIVDLILFHIGNREYHTGYGVRLGKIFEMNNIKTVGDLLRIGRRNFRKYRSVGGGSISRIDDALEDLYNIKGW
jgi:hypothetical protein